MSSYPVDNVLYARISGMCKKVWKPQLDVGKTFGINRNLMWPYDCKKSNVLSVWNIEVKILILRILEI